MFAADTKDKPDVSLMMQAVFKLSASTLGCDTSFFIVSYNAQRFQCGVLTQEVKCLLTQIYMVESALCAG